MAQIVLGTVGAVVGGYFGGPQGAQIGFALGSFIGGAIDRSLEDPAQLQGPRLSDLQSSGSSYGGPIPLGYGALRMGSNVIWKAPLRELEERREEGGKGVPPTAEVTTYTYFASWAAAFAAGPADEMLRMWFDNDLVYDKRGQRAVKTQGLNFRFYHGTETQLPDPAMEAAAGVGNVPGHRGLVYVVIDDFPVAKYGNRVPVVSAEIAFNAVDATTDRFASETTAIFDTININPMGVDVKRRRAYLMGTRTVASTDLGLRVYDLDSLNELTQIRDDDILDSGSFHASSAFTVGKNTGRIYCNIGTTDPRAIVKINPDTLRELDRTSITHPTLKHIVEVTALTPPTGVDGDVTVTKRNFLFVVDTFDRYAVFDADNLLMTRIFNDTTVRSGTRAIVAGKPELGQGVVYALQGGTGNATINVNKIIISYFANIGFGPVGTQLITPVDTIDPSAWNNDGSGAPLGPVLDEGDNGLIFLKKGSTFAGTYVFKWREDEGVIWTAKVGVTVVPASDEAMAAQSSVTNSTFGFVGSSSQECCLINTVDGTVLVDVFDWGSLTPTANPTGQQVFLGDAQSILAAHSGAPGFLGEIFLDRATAGATTDGAIVADISDRVGLEPADIDTTELTRAVRGYGISRQTTARRALEPLGIAYLWDGVESDDKMVFKNRGRASTRTILDSDMIPVNLETHSVVVEDRIQEVELPMRVAITYMDIDSNYQAGAQGVKRILDPTPTMRSRNDASIEVPIVLTAAEAEQIAETLLFTAWHERTKYSWKTAWDHLDLDPADVVTLTVSGSGTETTIRTRISRTRVGVNYSIEFDGFKEDQVTVFSDSTADGGLGVPEDIIPGPSFTRLFLMDIPLLRDVDDTGRNASRLYEGMNGFSANWPGGSLWESADGIQFDNTFIRNTGAIKYGFVLNSLPATNTPFQTDETTELTVNMSAGGELESVTQTQFLNNESVALIGDLDTQTWEIVCFRDAVLVSDNQYTVSGLMRGRRGTDINTDTHGTNEFFLVLTRNTVSAHTLDLTLLNTLRYYKGVGTGSLVENADIEPLASQMSDLKPYAPVDLDAVPDGSDNVDLSWTRRTRVAGALRDFTPEIPISEDSEEYEVDILDAPGGSIVRAVTSLSSDTYEYTKANITTDIAITTGVTTLDVASAFKFSRASGSFITDGFVVGDTIETTGFTDGANNGIFTVTDVSATQLEVSVTSLVVESGGGNEEIEVIRQADITFVVYQISAQVGRGFGREVTITF